MKKEVFNQYVDRVVNLFDINKDELFAKNKRRDIADARQLLYYICYKRPMQINYIQKFMKENGYPISHSSIIHGINCVERKMTSDKDYFNVMKEITKAVSI
jgi:chromosomal replication initiation ATPase DnaA